MLSVSHVDVYYGDLQALWDVSIDIGDGEIVALIGSNGAGKSTIMKAVAGLLKPKEGSISFEGTRIDRLPAHRIIELGISMVPEGRRLFPEMTVLENLEVGASVKKARSARHSTIKEIYDTFPILEKRAKQRAGTLSGGEQQMLAIGRALMSRSRLLIIDEMSLGLSPIVTQEIARVIKYLNVSRRLSILLVEQDVQLALKLANRAYIIENGHIRDQGDAVAFLRSEQIKEAYLGL
jgi:branched-chain amino acid transport system ATP-binding protein